MTTVRKHYEEHLGPVYSWLSGGLDVALGRGAAEIDALNLAPRDSASRWIWAGFGMHSIALAELGFEVVSIDCCGTLLAELESRKGESVINRAQTDSR